MSMLTHPDLDDVPLAAALHALADPARLTILRRLAEAECLNCESALSVETVPASTRSNHFRILRAAGLIRTEKSGRNYVSRLRRDEVERRFPGLLDTVLSAAAADALTPS